MFVAMHCGEPGVPKLFARWHTRGHADFDGVAALPVAARQQDEPSFDVVIILHLHA